MRDKINIKAGLTNFQIKIIALISMIFGHMSLIFSGIVGPDLSRLIFLGSGTFILFAFLISEGCRHTRSMVKYMLRLLIFAVSTQLCFEAVVYFIKTFAVDASAMFGGLPKLNILFALFLAVFSIYGYEKIKHGLLFGKVFAFVPLITAMAAARFFGVDYSWLGVILIFAFYFFNGKRILQSISVIVFLVLQYRYYLNANYLKMLISGDGTYFLIPIFGMLSIVFINLYNGELGRKGRKWKWFFYLAYPGHFAVLGAIFFLCMFLGW